MGRILLTYLLGALACGRALAADAPPAASDGSPPTGRDAARPAPPPPVRAVEVLDEDLAGVGVVEVSTGVDGAVDGDEDAAGFETPAGDSPAFALPTSPPPTAPLAPGVAALGAATAAAELVKLLVPRSKRRPRHVKGAAAVAGALAYLALPLAPVPVQVAVAVCLWVVDWALGGHRRRREGRGTPAPDPTRRRARRRLPRSPEEREAEAREVDRKAGL